ncbi:hypothetical protein BGX26_000650 [Mortierella sp. AD094]|nr:hypothetical protein BGX26_000650 [Mortierella sp. AD094]
MSATKSTMMMAILALFLCMTSTVTAANLYAPGSPFNCTAFANNCQTLTTSLYGGKNSSYQGPSTQCSNSSNLPAVQSLCNEKVLCLATFLVQSNASTTTTTTTTAAAVPTGNGTTNGTVAPTRPIASDLYTFTSVDVTSQLLDLYDTSKCSAAIAQVATSFGALAVIATVVSMVSSML